MSSEGTKYVSGSDIQLVQNLIERCIQLHMNRGEAVNTLWSQAKIDQHFTELEVYIKEMENEAERKRNEAERSLKKGHLNQIRLDIICGQDSLREDTVWQKLEEENQDFFEAYNLRLALKDHITIFNELLRQQALLMNELQSTGVHNGSHTSYCQQNSESYASEPLIGTESVKQENLNTSFSSSLPHPQTNGLLHMHGSLHTAVSLPGPSGRIGCSVLSPQSSDLRMINGINGVGGATIKQELDDYAFSSQFLFGVNADGLDTHENMRNEQIGSYNSLEPRSESLGSSLDHIALLGPNSQNLRFSNMPTNYSVSGILEGSPFLGSNNFLCSEEGGELLDEENIKLENISESLSFDDFRS